MTHPPLRLVTTLPPVEDVAGTADALTVYPRALVESSLEKVLESPVFRRSERHRRFMRHIVAAVLDGRRDRLKEVLLAIELFERDLDRYDPRVDPIVRVEAGRVREKLARYYRADGAADLFAFDVPVGSYAPTFRRQVVATRVRPVETFAVMPFSDNGSGADAAFGIGLADQVINLLGRVPDVKVVARFSAFQARERQLGVKALGKLLSVTRVIDGSVQRDGARIRCVVHVHRARDGVVLWSRSFDSHPSFCPVGGEVDVFGFQDHVAAALLAAASPSAADVAGDPGHGRSPPVAGDLAADTRHAARDLYERASYLARRYEAAQGPKVVDLLERSIALDPGHAPAHAALATACFHQVTLLTAPGNPMRPRIETALANALALDPNNAEAIALRAMIVFRLGLDWRAADAAFREALRISPYNSSVNYRYAFCLILNGDFETGLRHARAAVELDPLNLGVRAMGAQLLAYARRYTEAEAEARNVIDLEPGHLYMNFVLALIHLYRHAWDDAVQRFDAVIALHPDHPAAPLGRVCALGLLGERERGRRELEAFLQRTADRYCPPHSLAMAYLGLGDDARCDAALERAAREGDPGLCTLSVDPLFAARHGDPAFRAWMTSRGLCPPIA